MEKTDLLTKGMLVVGIPAILVGVVGCDDQSAIDQQKAQDEFIKQETLKETMQQRNQENSELNSMLIQMRQRDPSIVDLYYGLDDKGQKELHVIKDDTLTNAQLTNTYIDPNTNQLSVDELSKLYDKKKDSNSDFDTGPQSWDNPPAPNATVAAAPAQTQTVVMDHSHSYSDSVFPLINGITTGLLLSHFMNGGMNSLNNTYHPQMYSNLSMEERKRRQNAAFFGYMGSSMSSHRSNVVSRVNSGALKSPALTTRSSGFFSKSSSARSGGYSHGG